MLLVKDGITIDIENKVDIDRLKRLGYVEVLSRGAKLPVEELEPKTDADEKEGA